MEETNKSHKKSYDWLKQYQFQKGNPGGPGRPKGQTLKEFARQFLMSLPDEEKTAFLACLPEDLVWRMAEGNPTDEVDHKGKLDFTIRVEHDNNSVETPQEPKQDTSQ